MPIINLFVAKEEVDCNDVVRRHVTGATAPGAKLEDVISHLVALGRALKGQIPLTLESS
jgi:hypothetical protein